MTYAVRTRVGDSIPQIPAPKPATESTEVGDLPEIAPDGDDFTCAVARIYDAGRVFGFRVRISTVGVIGTAAEWEAFLRVENLDNGAILTDNFPIFCSADSHFGLVNEAVGTVMGPLSSALAGHVAAGAALRLVWTESGTIGTAVRPKIQFLGFDVRNPTPAEF